MIAAPDPVLLYQPGSYRTARAGHHVDGRESQVRRAI